MSPLYGSCTASHLYETTVGSQSHQRLPNLKDSPEHFVRGIPSSEDAVFPVSVAAVVNAIYRQRLCCGGNIPQLFSLCLAVASSAELRSVTLSSTCE